MNEQHDIPPPRWTEGTRLGARYQVRRLLGRGGMGEVYVAWDEVLAKEVALKRLHHTDAAALEQLRREVVFAQQVTHENVCRTYDLELLDGDAVIKMQYVAGQTLAERLTPGPPLSVDEALRIARELVAGLGAVHAAGLVHRDLKPSNVILDERGVARLMDFGIASDGGTSSGENVVAGTPSFMSPEQIKGEPVDGRTDFYALGCVIHFMLTGRSPFAEARSQPTPDEPAEPATATATLSGASSPPASPVVLGSDGSARRLSLWAQHLTQPAADLRQLRPDVPAWLARLTDELLAKRPDGRPADAATLLQRLREPERRGRRWRRRAPLIGGAAIGCVALLVAGVAWRARQAAQWRPTTHELQDFDDAMGATLHFTPDGRSLVFGAHRDGQFRLWSAPLGGGGAHPVTPPGLKYGYYMRDGQRLLVFGERGGMGIYRPNDGDGGELTWLSQTASDGDDCGSVGVVTVELEKHTHQPSRIVADDGAGHTRTLYLVPDKPTYIGNLLCDDASKRLLFSTITPKGGHRLWLLPLTGNAMPTRLFPDREVGPAHFTPDGQHLLIAFADQGVHHIYETSFDGRAQRQLTFGSGEIAATPSPDGQRLVVVEENSDRPIYALEPGGVRAHRVTFGHGRATEFYRTPDDRGLVTIIRRGNVNSVEVVPSDGSGVRVLAPNVQGLAGLDSHGFVYYRQKSALWRVPYGGGSAERMGPLTGSYRLDHDWLYYTANDGDGGAPRKLRRRVDGSGAPEPVPVTGWEQVRTSPSQWRAVFNEHSPEFSLYAPGADLKGPATATFPRSNFKWSADGRSLLWVDLAKGEIHRRWLADNRDQLLQSSGFAYWAGDSCDGTLYWIEDSTQARAFVIDNFGTRPPL